MAIRFCTSRTGTAHCCPLRSVRLGYTSEIDHEVENREINANSGWRFLLDGPFAMDITLETRVAVSPEVMLQEVGGEAVLLDLNSESYFGLDAVGTRIWRLVEQDGHLKAVHSALLDEFDVDAARLEHDLKELIAHLAEAGLVNVEAPRAPQV